jgi:dienelactone hydrolase
MMRFQIFSSVLAVALVIPAQVFGQDIDIRGLPARLEIHNFASITISDEQFLNGDDQGSAVIVSGELRIARGQGQRPAVIMLHGSGGIGSKEQLWSNMMNDAGISTFVVDSFTGRGLTRVSADQKLLGRLNMIVDAYRALHVLAEHPRIDPSRIALMGFSRGGQGALYAAMTRFHNMWNDSNLSFIAYIPFYPNCATTYSTDSNVEDVPIRIFHGTADDSSPLTPCRRYVGRLLEENRDVRLTEYENASHAFDLPTLSTTPESRSDAQTSGWCTITERDNGKLINANTGQIFTYEDDCVRSFHVGHDPVATRSAYSAVIRELTEIFAL